MGRDLLAGRTALVTGGSGGIGRALALQLAAEGTAVALGFRTSRESAEQLAAEIAEQGRPVVAIEADLSKPEAPVELAEGVEFALGPIEILVANAGVGRVASYEEVDGALFDETLAVNLRAPYLLARHVLPGMRERGFGRIVFISSVAGFIGGIVGPHYAASKAALHGLTHYFAPRVAPDGVTVNAIAAGADRGHRNRARRPATARRTDTGRPPRNARRGRRPHCRRPSERLHHQPGLQHRRRRLPALSANRADSDSKLSPPPPPRIGRSRAALVSLLR